MKKLAILLSLVMVLGLAVSASAAVTVSGELKMTVTNQDKDEDGNAIELDFLESYRITDAKVNFASQVNDNLKVTIQTNLTKNPILQNHWLDYKVGNVTVKAGKYSVSRGGEVNSLSGDKTGVGATYAFDGGNASAVLVPGKDNLFIFNGKFSPMAGLTVLGDFFMDTADNAKKNYVVEADYAVSGVTVFGEMGKVDDNDVLVVGAKTKVADVTLKGRYYIEHATKEFDFNAETVYNGLTLAANFAQDKDQDLKITGSVAVKF